MRNIFFTPSLLITIVLWSCSPSQKELRDKQIEDSTNKAILTADSIIKAQHIKDFFLPKNEYFDRTFRFESEKWENENGQFQDKNIVTYFKDPSGNYKKYTQQTSYRYNIPQLTSNVHEFYYVGSNKVNFIYSYIEGVSEELKQLGLIDDNNRYKIILKLPPAEWIDKTDPDVTENYKSEFGELVTDYGKYENCIIVTKSNKLATKNVDLKFYENFVEKYFYAYNLGLVKTETYEKGKLIQMVGSGTLVDDFSEYSFKRKQKTEKITEEKNITEENKLLVGILDRPDINSFFQYTSDEWMDLSKGFEYGAEHPIKETTEIRETESRIIIDFSNGKSLIYEIVKVEPYEYGINYIVEINGKRKTITKGPSVEGGIIFSLEKEWMFTKIFEAFPAGID